MTKQQHPITPPPELVEQWATEYYGQPVRLPNRHSGKYIATKAANWQLEQVVEWLERYEAVGLERDNFVVCLTYELKRAMRPQEDNS